MTTNTANIRRRWTRSVRPHIQRVFLAWFAENRHRFRVPLRITKRTDRVIDFRFVGITRAISVTLQRNCLWVNVTHDGEWFDALMDFDVCTAKRTPSGYICTFESKPEVERELFPTREALWRSHVCEGFLEWVNEDLAAARWLRVAEHHGLRSAKLVREDEDRRYPVDVARLGKLRRLDGTTILKSGDVIEVSMYPIDSDEPTEEQGFELTAKYDAIE